MKSTQKKKYQQDSPVQAKGGRLVQPPKAQQHQMAEMQAAADHSQPVQRLLQRQDAISNAAHQTTQVPVVQRAGTKPNQPTVDNRYRVKLSSQRESFVYGNRQALRLDDILPGCRTLNPGDYNVENGKIVSINIEGAENPLMLRLPIEAPANGQKVLRIDTVGWTGEVDGNQVATQAQDQKCYMDVKIGTYTKSTEQFEKEGAGGFMRFFKKIEHNLKDMNRDSRKLGYDIDKSNLESFLAIMMDEGRNIQLVKAIEAVRGRLEHIAEVMDTAPITFVGSSLFFVFNLTNPENSDVKLIDPDHPIVLDPKDMEMPDQLIRSSDFNGKSRTWKDYTEKWAGGFKTGMRNFILWMDQWKV